MSKMPFFRITTLLTLITFYALSAASDNGAELNWDECAEGALKQYNQNEGGITGGYLTIIDECGFRPTAKSGDRLQLLKSDCDWIYDYPLNECSAQENKDWCKRDDDMLLVSMSSWRGLWALPEKIFNNENFFKLCRQVCLGHPKPDKEYFANNFCSTQ